jgi:hypothetical protein
MLNGWRRASALARLVERDDEIGFPSPLSVRGRPWPWSRRVRSGLPSLVGIRSGPGFRAFWPRGSLSCELESKGWGVESIGFTRSEVAGAEVVIELASGSGSCVVDHGKVR